MLASEIFGKKVGRVGVFDVVDWSGGVDDTSASVTKSDVAFAVEAT